MDFDLYTRGNPHDVFREMRAEGPVHRQENEGSGFWAVVGYDAAKRVLSEWRVFSSARGLFLRDDPSAPYPGAGKMMVLSDPPRHTELRRVVTPLFTPRAVQKLSELAQRVAESLVADLRAQGGGDFVAEVSSKFPIAVQAEVLGIAPADVTLMTGATVRSMLRTGRTMDRDLAEKESAAGDHDMMMYYFKALIERRGIPGTDILGALLDAREGGLALSDEETVLMCYNILIAASQTSGHTISGGLLAMLERPDTWQALRSGDVDIDIAIDELLRWTTPVTHTMRTAVVDTELAGTPIRAGDPVAVWSASANRDETVFDRPDELILDRRPNPHLALGNGVHFCLGASLVHVMLRALYEALFADPAPRLAGPAGLNSTCFSNGLTSLPLTFERA